MAKAKTKKVNLPRDYMFNGQTYLAGNQVEVPADFPDLQDNGDVQWPEGSRAERNQQRSRGMGSPPNTGGVNTGEGQAPESTEPTEQ